MGVATAGAGKAFDLSNWRESIQARREIIRSIIVRAAVDGERLDPVIEEFKRAVGWSRLSDQDRNLLNVMFHDIRSIVWNWPLIPLKDRDAFVAGKIVPSTMAKQARALGALQ
jgi:hypothetical protein